ncbi:MAG TPA: hypothetical protein VLA29_05485, partial [Acidimicrobiia bacterium]|nr:hypothetical protein [Acidimicrobiia bacterium]
MTTTDSAIARIKPDHEARETVRSWSMVALALFILNLVAYVGFSVAGGIFFAISDALALLLAAAMVPVITGMAGVLESERLSPWVTRTGLAGAGIIGVGALVLLTSEAGHEFVPASGGLGLQFVGFALIGVWLVGSARSAAPTSRFSRRTVWSAHVAGVGFAVG